MFTSDLLCGRTKILDPIGLTRKVKCDFISALIRCWRNNKRNLDHILDLLTELLKNIIDAINSWITSL